MKTTTAAVATALSLISGAYANKDVITLNTNGNAWIQEASATLIVPELPESVTGDIALWSAIMMDDFNGDFLQGVTQSSPASTSYCAEDHGDWCNFAYTLKGMSPTVGDAIIAKPGSEVKTHYKLNPSTNEWDQEVFINGEMVSTVSTSSGQHGTTFYISIECASGPCANAPAHTWENVSVVLNEADSDFGHTGGWEFGATGGEMSTSDQGKTWNFGTLSVPETPIEYSA